MPAGGRLRFGDLLARHSLSHVAQSTLLPLLTRVRELRREPPAVLVGADRSDLLRYRGHVPRGGQEHWAEVPAHTAVTSGRSE
jgi:hypothetical protein